MRKFSISLSVCLLLLAPILQLWSKVPAACDILVSAALVEKAKCCFQSTPSVQSNQSEPVFSVLMARPDCCLQSECCAPTEPFAKLPCVRANNQQANAPPLSVTTLAAIAPPSFDSWKSTLRPTAAQHPTTVRSRLSRIQSWRI